MKFDQKRIIVCCSRTISGGPELLHQLVNELRGLGREAYISYYPFGQSYSCPEPYRKYAAPQAEITDDEETLVVVPEVATWIVRDLKRAKTAVWWLSVDNYFLAKHQSAWRDFYLRYKSLVRARLPLWRLRGCAHLVQSHYARDFLMSAGIGSVPLTDYLSVEHLSNPFGGDFSVKEDIVAYNPKKGQKQTAKIIDANPDVKFVPIQNMNSLEVANLLRRAKVYIDFGHHPGKDRPPREAAIAGCCVVTGRRGAARFAEDVRIPDQYKLDDLSGLYARQFQTLVKDVFLRFDEHFVNFDAYRRSIFGERECFKAQVRDLFV